MKLSVSISIIGGGLLAASLWALPAHATSEAETADLLVKFIQAGRTVVSGHQDLINDPTKGDKGFTPDYLAERITQKYKELAQIDLNRPGTTPQFRLLMTLLDCGKEVVAEAQPVINKQGVAFKGFIPAVWGRKTGEKFTQRTGIQLKLTAQEFRYPGNKPDDFEVEVLKMFSQPSYPKGRGYSQVLTVDGKPVLRYMAPEYATGRCLQCHGEPRGIRDQTGFKREGFKEGDVMGAISLVLPIQSTLEGVSKVPTSRKKGGT
jgi:general secretion pathway protein A